MHDLAETGECLLATILQLFLLDLSAGLTAIGVRRVCYQRLAWKYLAVMTQRL